MRYLNTRDTFLTIRDFKPVNETFTNDITWGGSLLGRFINSTLRKAAAGVNALRVIKIGDEIEKKILELLVESTGVDVSNVTITALLAKIYICVMSSESDRIKIDELLTLKDGSGLIDNLLYELKKINEVTITIGADNAQVDKKELVEKLEKFKKEIEDLNKTVSKDDREEEDAEEVEENDSPQNGDEILYTSTVKLLNSIIGIYNCVNYYNKKIKGAEQTNQTKKTEQPKQLKEPEQPKQLKEPEQKSIEAEKQIMPGKENSSVKLFNFSDFEKIFEADVYGKVGKSYPSPNNQNTQPTQNKETGLVKTKPTETGLVKIDEPKKDNSPKNDTSIIERFLKAYRSSGVEKLIPSIETILKDKSRKDIIIKIGKQIKINETTLGKNKIESITEAITDSNADINNISKSVTLLSNFLVGFISGNRTSHDTKFNEKILQTLDEKFISKLNSISFFIKNFIKSFLVIIEIKLEPKEEEPKELVKKESFLTNFDNFIRLYEQENTNAEVITSAPNEGQNSKEGQDSKEEEEEVSQVKQSWNNNFTDEESTKWSIKEWKKVENLVIIKNKEIERVKNIEIDVDDSKVKIIQIADLFGKAYRRFVTLNIPSGRPGGRVSNTTFNEYIPLGEGTPSYSPDSAPTGGPWANKFVFHAFSDRISKILEDKSLRKIFDSCSLKTASGVVEEKGNFLTEFIRDMIDENKLKSYGKLRSELLNKYYGLKKSYADDTSYASKNDIKVKPEDIVEGAEVQWRTLAKVSREIKKGQFISINFKANKIEKEESKDDWRTATGQVLYIDDSGLLFKFMFNTDGIPLTYGARIVPENQIHGSTNFQNKNVFIGWVPQNLKPKIKFNFSYFDINKQEQIQTYKDVFLSKREVAAGKVARSKAEPLSRLETIKDGGFIPIVKTNWDRISKDRISKDVAITNDETLENFAKRFKGLK